MMRRSATILALVLLLPGSVQAQPAAAAALDSLRAAYRALDYAAVEVQAQAALAAPERFAPEERAEIHEILALTRFAQGNPEAAQHHFREVLRLEPAHQLDSLLVSPKILDFFAEVRQAMGTAPVEAPPRVVVVEDLRAAAALRSALVPGWGQLYKGEQTKGAVMLGVWSGAAAGTLLATALRADAGRALRDETDPAERDALRRRRDRWERRRNLFVGIGAGVWLYAYVDALIGHRPLVPAARRLHVEANLLASHVQVRLVF